MFFGEITPTITYMELINIEGLTETMIRKWRPEAKNIQQILKQSREHITAIKENNNERKE